MRSGTNHKGRVMTDSDNSPARGARGWQRQPGTPPSGRARGRCRADRAAPRFGASAARRAMSSSRCPTRAAPLGPRGRWCIPARSKVFESPGLVDRFLDAGCKQRIIKIHSGGKVLGNLRDSSTGSIYGFNLGLSEEAAESILTAYLHQQGGEGEPDRLGWSKPYTPSRWGAGRHRARRRPLPSGCPVGGGGATALTARRAN